MIVAAAAAVVVLTVVGFGFYVADILVVGGLTMTLAAAPTVADIAPVGWLAAAAAASAALLARRWSRGPTSARLAGPIIVFVAATAAADIVAMAPIDELIDAWSLVLLALVAGAQLGRRNGRAPAARGARGDGEGRGGNYTESGDRVVGKIRGAGNGIGRAFTKNTSARLRAPSARKAGRPPMRKSDENVVVPASLVADGSRVHAPMWSPEVVSHRLAHLAQDARSERDRRYGPEGDPRTPGARG